MDNWGSQAGLKVEGLVLTIKEFTLDFVGCSSQSPLNDKNHPPQKVLESSDRSLCWLVRAWI